VSAGLLDQFLPEPAVRVAHRRTTQHATTDELWRAAGRLRLDQTRVLGQLVRWRIPGLPADLRYLELLRSEPFVVLHEAQHELVCGLCGRIWTLRRDYPVLDGADAFRAFHQPGTVRVLYANWVADAADGAAISAEVRVQPVDARGRLGLTAVRPLISAFQGLISSEALATTIRHAERNES
jgi:hypothetical protein